MDTLLQYIVTLVQKLLSRSTTRPAGEVITPMAPIPDIYKYFSRQECLKDRDKEYPLSKELESNLVELLTRLNRLRADYGKPLTINSLYRPGHYNTDVGGANNSAHLTCEACDFGDSTRALRNWIFEDLTRLAKYDLYMEDPSYTNVWIHVQSRPIPSGARIFKPK